MTARTEKQIAAEAGRLNRMLVCEHDTDSVRIPCLRAALREVTDWFNATKEEWETLPADVRQAVSRAYLWKHRQSDERPSAFIRRMKP